MDSRCGTAIAVAVAALLTSCAGVAEAPGPVTVQESVTVEKTSPPAAALEAEKVANLEAAPTDTAYLQAARAVVARTNLNSLADADLIGLAKSFCDGITNGATPEDFAKSASLMVVPLRTYRSVLALAQITYCPQHIDFRI